MDTKKIEAHSAETKKLVDQYLSDKSDRFRIEAQENASRLAQALERPKDTILKLAYSVSSYSPTNKVRRYTHETLESPQ